MTTEKLKNGDYFDGGTEEQYRELLVIKPFYAFSFNLCDHGLVAFQSDKLPELQLVFREPTDENFEGLVPHAFEEFKQKCINTFGNGE